MEQGGHVPQGPSSTDLGALWRGLAATYLRGGAAMEQVARLADEHAEREERLGRLESAARERRAAAKARDAAAQCRANAQRLR